MIDRNGIEVTEVSRDKRSGAVYEVELTWGDKRITLAKNNKNKIIETARVSLSGARDAKVYFPTDIYKALMGKAAGILSGRS